MVIFVFMFCPCGSAVLRRSLAEDAGRFFDKETGVLEVPLSVQVADQVKDACTHTHTHVHTHAHTHTDTHTLFPTRIFLPTEQRNKELSAKQSPTHTQGMTQLSAPAHKHNAFTQMHLFTH